MNSADLECENYGVGMRGMRIFNKRQAGMFYIAHYPRWQGGNSFFWPCSNHSDDAKYKFQSVHVDADDGHQPTERDIFHHQQVLLTEQLKTKIVTLTTPRYLSP